MEGDSDNISVAIVDMLQQLILGAEGTNYRRECMLVLILVWSATGEAVIHCWVHRCWLLLLLGTGDPGLLMVAGAGVVPLLLRRVLGDRRHGARQERTGDNARQWRARHRAPHVDLLQKINISK